MSLRPLTRREQEFLDLRGSGLSDEEIAVRCGVKVTTVRYRLNFARRAMGYAGQNVGRPARVLESEADELARLIREQERDSRSWFVSRRGALSLDRRMYGANGELSLFDRIADSMGDV